MTRVKVQPVAPLVGGHQHGLAACFAGTIDGTPYIAGGANFPDVPCAEGGTKHFYQDIYAYDGQRWTQRGKLPFEWPVVPVPTSTRSAYFASVGKVMRGYIEKPLSFPLMASRLCPTCR